MPFSDMNPDDLAAAWRERGPKLEGLRVRAQSGEITWKIGDNRLVAFLRAGEWRTKRNDGHWEGTRRVSWQKNSSPSFPLASFEDLVLLVTDLQATERACG